MPERHCPDVGALDLRHLYAGTAGPGHPSKLAAILLTRGTWASVLIATFMRGKWRGNLPIGSRSSPIVVPFGEIVPSQTRSFDPADPFPQILLKDLADSAPLTLHVF